MAAVAPGIIEAAEVDFYAFAFKDINFTSSEKVIFADLAGWRFVQVAKPVDAFRRLVVAQSDIIKKQRLNVFVFAQSAIYTALQKIKILFINYTG